MTFAERLRMLRLEAGMSLDDVGKAINVGRSNIYKYEHGVVTNVPPEKIHALANLFGVTRPYLMGWTDERNVNPSANLDTVAEHQKMSVGEIVKENNTTFWRAVRDDSIDCTTAATQAARALIKFNIARTPIYPQQILQSSKYATMVSFENDYELDDIMMNTNVITSQKHDNLVMSSIYMDESGQTNYLFAVNRNAPMGHLKLALAVELGHIYLGHNSHFAQTTKRNQEAECFALHLEFPRPLIKLLQERGFVFTKETFSRIFGDCEWCIDSIMNAKPVRISPELNRLVKEQFTPYVDKLEDLGVLQIPIRGNAIDLRSYMAGYEE